MVTNPANKKCITCYYLCMIGKYAVMRCAGCKYFIKEFLHNRPSRYRKHPGITN